MTDPNQKAYDQFAQDYHEKRNCDRDSLWNQHLDRPMLQELLRVGPSGGRTLDLGCGSGLFTRWLKDNGFDTYGLDFSKELIAIAEKENPDIPFSIADIAQTDFADSTFETVVSGLVMHYIQDLDPVFAEVHRILQKDAVFIFSLHHPFDEVIEIGDDGRAYAHSYFHNNRYTWSMLEGMELVSYHHTFEAISESLRSNGFVIECIREARAADDLKSAYPEFYDRTHRYPTFCGFRARKAC